MRKLFIPHSVFPYIRKKIKEKGKKRGGGVGEILFYFLFEGKFFTRKNNKYFKSK